MAMILPLIIIVMKILSNQLAPVSDDVYSDVYSHVLTVDCTRHCSTKTEPSCDKGPLAEKR